MTTNVRRLRGRTWWMRVDFARFLPSLVLAGYGIFILSLFARNALTLYINPSYVWPSTLAGVVLIGLALVRLTVRGDAVCDCGVSECGGDCGSEHTPRRLWPYAFLCVPLVLAVLVPPRGLADFSARQRGLQIAGLTSVRGAGTVKRVSLSVDTRAFNLQDWVGALSADPNPRDYMGKPVRLTGIVIHDSASVPPGFIMVLRYQVTCCIADARPVGLIVRDSSHGALKDNQWVTVTGTMGETSFSGQKVAVVEPNSMTPAKSGNPYIY